MSASAQLGVGDATMGVTGAGVSGEIEFMSDGDVEIEIFQSDGEIHDATMIEQLFQRHAESE